MADKTFKLEVITPERVVFSDKDVTSVTAPGIEGYFGVLASHEPFMTELAIGELDYRRSDGSEDKMAVAGGFFEVFDNTVTVLAEIAEKREEIDVERAESSLHRAEERLASHATDIDMDRVRVALLKAMNRLRVAGHI